jgi:hypothetical protein
MPAKAWMRTAATPACGYENDTRRRTDRREGTCRASELRLRHRDNQAGAFALGGRLIEIALTTKSKRQSSRGEK